MPDVDAVVERAVERGAKVTTPLEDTFYGVRRASLRDPFGHRWIVGTQIREVAAEDYAKAREEFAQTTAS